MNKNLKEYSINEIKRHNSEKSLWIVINNLVYDVTKFTKHPGTYDNLLLHAGKDASKPFNDIHSKEAIKLR